MCFADRRALKRRFSWRKASNDCKMFWPKFALWLQSLCQLSTDIRSFRFVRLLSAGVWSTQNLPRSMPKVKPKKSRKPYRYVPEALEGIKIEWQRMPKRMSPPVQAGVRTVSSTAPQITYFRNSIYRPADLLRPGRQTDEKQAIWISNQFCINKGVMY